MSFCGPDAFLPDLGSEPIAIFCVKFCDTAKVKAQDKLDHMQSIDEMDLPPCISSMKGFKLDMCFVYPGEGGAQCLHWYRGTVEHVIDEEKYIVLIKWEWDPETLATNDVTKSVHKVLPFHWNPKKIRKNACAWREYLTD